MQKRDNDQHVYVHVILSLLKYLCMIKPKEVETVDELLVLLEEDQSVFGRTNRVIELILALLVSC